MHIAHRTTTTKRVSKHFEDDKLTERNAVVTPFWFIGPSQINPGQSVCCIKLNAGVFI